MLFIFLLILRGAAREGPQLHGDESRSTNKSTTTAHLVPQGLTSNMVADELSILAANYYAHLSRGGTWIIEANDGDGRSAPDPDKASALF